MIIKKLKPVHGGVFPGAAYNEKKVSEGVAELAGWANIDGNFLHTLQTLHSVGIDCGSEVEEYMQSRSQTFGNTRSTQFQVHLALSCKGQEKNKEQLVAIAHAMMKEYGADKQPYLIYFHHDTKNNHVHILSTRVNQIGKLLPDHQDYRKLNNALNRVLKDDQKNDVARMMAYNFTTEGQFINIARGFNFTVGESETDKSSLVLYHGGAVAFSVDRKKLAAIIEKHKANSEEQQKRDAEAKRLKAIFIKYREMSLKQTVPSANKFDKADEKSEHAKTKKEVVEKKPKINPDIKKLIGKDGKPLTEIEQYQLNWFVEQLHSKFGITVHFQKDRNGVARGYGIVDHNNKVALNGSEIMKLADIVSFKQWQTVQGNKAEKVGRKTENNKQTQRPTLNIDLSQRQTANDSTRTAWTTGRTHNNSTSSTATAKPQVKARIYQRDSTLNIYRPIFKTSVSNKNGRSILGITFPDGSSYSAELTDGQALWYSKAGSSEERHDIAIRLALFQFSKQIYDAYKHQLLDDYIKHRSKAFKFPLKVGLRCYKHKNGNWFLETDGLRCNIKYKLNKDEVKRVIDIDRNSKEFFTVKKELFFSRYAKEEIDALSKHLDYEKAGLIPRRTATVNDIQTFTDSHVQAMRRLAATLSANVGNGTNREWEVGHHMSLEDIDDERRFHRGLYM